MRKRTQNTKDAPQRVRIYFPQTNCVGKGPAEATSREQFRRADRRGNLDSEKDLALAEIRAEI